MRMAVNIAAGILVALAIALGSYLWVSRSTGASASHPLPETTYGPPGGRFSVSFGTAVTPASETDVQSDEISGQYPTAGGYLASFNVSAYEEVQVAVYSYTLKGPGIRRFLDTQTGSTYDPWNGLPGAFEDVACHLPESNAGCPGRIAFRYVVSGRALYEIVGMRVSAREWHRFLSSFHVAG